MDEYMIGLDSCAWFSGISYLEYFCTFIFPFNLICIYLYISTPLGNVTVHVLCICLCVFGCMFCVKDKEVTDRDSLCRAGPCAIMFFMLFCSIIKLTEFGQWPGGACLLSIHLWRSTEAETYALSKAFNRPKPKWDLNLCPKQETRGLNRPL